jgi:hypothetical protein
MSVRKLNEARTDYTHSYNFSNGTFIAKASGLQTKTYTFASETRNQLEVVLMPSTVESKTYSIVCAAGSLALDAKVPDAINEFNFNVVQNVTATIASGGKTSINAGGATVTTPAGQELSNPGENGPLVAFNFTYTKTSGTLTLDRQPLNSDITGANMNVTLGDAISSGSGDLLFDDTTGFIAGMYVEDVAFEEGNVSNSRLPADAKGNLPIINTIQADTKITIKGQEPPYTAVTAQAAIPENENNVLRIFSDWEYDLVTAVATINEQATVVTVVGTLRVLRYGTSAISGNVILQPNFLTIS